MNSPLARDNVTAAARVMLPAYVVTFAWLGAGWLFSEPATIVKTPALAYADSALDIRWWGVLLLFVAAIILAALLSCRRLPCRIALWIGAVSMLVFVGVFLLASLRGEATISAAAWPFLAACACYASDRSLLKGEVS